MQKISEFINELNAYDGQTIVLKIGGEPIAQNKHFLENLAQQILFLQRLKTNIILVHGAGPQINAAMKEEGITRRKHESGRYQTSPKELPIVHQVMNKVSAEVTQALTQKGCHAYNLSLSKHPIFFAQPLTDDEQDYTGKPHSIDFLSTLKILTRGQTIVTHSMGYDKNNKSWLNVNADDCAMCFATELQTKRLILATDTNGVLNDKKKTIPVITPPKAKRLQSKGIIEGGMAVKVESAINAIEKGVGGVAIINAFQENALILELGTKGGSGTLIQPRPLNHKPLTLMR